METISVTIPREKEALRKTADYLLDLAGESREATVNIKDGAAGPIEVELDPEAEAAATSDHIDAMVSTAGAAELDIDGRKWDVRIDSSAKTKTKDGRWKLVRNVDPAFVEQVKAELSVAPMAVAPPAVPPVVETAPVAPPVETPAAAAINTYAQLVPRITAMANTVPPTLQQHDVMDALNSSGAFIAGATNLTELAEPEHAHFIPLVAAELEKLWATRV
jgi:hypothetical protein